MSDDDFIASIKPRVEAALFAAGEPLSVDRLIALFGSEEGETPESKPPEGDNEKAVVSRAQINQVLQALQEEYEERGVELTRVASGYRFQVAPELGGWVARLWQEKPARYSRALLETLAIIAYQQPVTRAEIEEIRGVSVSTPIMKNLLQREWVKSVGQRDVPGRPAVYATTRQFLDHFNLSTLSQLPPLEDIRDIADLTPELDFSDPESAEHTEGETGTDEAASELDSQDSPVSKDESLQLPPLPGVDE
ncbi:MAG: SMC-Scp complex subunit ScpB [Gammaproteobacteria bacterium]